MINTQTAQVNTVMMSNIVPTNWDNASITQSMPIVWTNAFIKQEPISPYDNKHFIRIDDWIPPKEDQRLVPLANSIRIDFGNLKYDDQSINWMALQNFMLASQKRCYNNIDIKMKMCKYINYFLKYYDPEKELLFAYFRIKIEVDQRYLKTGHNVSFDEFVALLKKYIINESIYRKVGRLNEDNYSLSLKYENKNNRALQYNDTHGKYFMEISVMQNILIPIMMHWLYINNIKMNVEEYILKIYNILIDRYQDVDIIAKLYETTNTTTNNDEKHNHKLWEKNKIRGKTTLTCSLEELNTCIIQVMPKYRYDSNIIIYNFKSFRNMIGYSVTDISYEYDLIPLSASKRDGEDNASQMDKFEAGQSRISESIKVENNFNVIHTIERLYRSFGPFYKEEMEWYRKRLTAGGRNLVNEFQKRVISLPLLKYFVNQQALNSINANDYLIMLMCVKNFMINNEMKLLPMIVSSRVVKISTRNNINKKEKLKLETSSNYNLVKSKYSSCWDRIEKAILSLIATIIASEFEVIDYFDKELDGTRIIVDTDFLIDEVLRYILLL